MTVDPMATRRTRSGSSTLVASRKNSKSAASVTSDAENDAASQGTGVESEKKVGRTRTKAAVTNTKTKRISSSRRKERIFCLCHGKDDGSAMIRCEGGCSNWFHFRCVSISEEDAHEIALYICPACEASTGMRTVLEWEGSDAMEPKDAFSAPVAEKPKISRKQSVETDTKMEVDKEGASEVEESDDGGSEDDYVAKPMSGRSKQRMLPNDSSQDSDADSDFSSRRPRRIVNGRRLASKSETPPARSAPKNKHKRQNSKSETPAAKRSKTSAVGTSDDPVRKYCLGQLEELITSIYLEYAIKAKDKDAPADSSENQDTHPDNDKSITEQKAKAFVHDLEECLHETYSERDKDSQLVAGPKYKERFRMLTFNLKKTDRVSLRSGIALGRITPVQLSTMSSTDLASEQTKHEIEIAEKEALEHSILKKMTAPRAKITRKGLEDIEDVNGSTQRDAERVKEEEAEERIERERHARLKVVVPTQNSTDSPTTASLPPSTIAQPWGSSTMSPSAPAHEPQLLSGSPISARPGRPLFIPSASDILAPIEGDLNLADLINIDGDSPPQELIPLPESRIPELVKQNEELQDKPHPTENLVIPSGPSPFTTSQPVQTTPTTTSFDLNTLWNDANDKPPSKPVEDAPTAPSAEDQAEPMDLDENSEQGSQDQDFDMFLGEDDKTTEKTDAPEEATEAPPTSVLDSLPVVWNGTVFMPVNALSSMSPSVVAKQLSGQVIEPGSPLWKVLFPSVEAKIDGRVPVDKSSQYLLTTQLNVSKELICVCLEPPPGSDGSQFKELLTFLVTKGRHALVFPWGLQPRPNAPGKELYLVPLLQGEPIPEFLELADDHRLPKERDHDLLLGVFVVNKGKLVLAPDAQRTLAAVQVPSAPSPPSGLPTAGPSSIPPPNTNINQNALAAEVASLTPEQIAIMLRHLNAIPTPEPTMNNPVSLPSTSRPAFPPAPFPSVPYNPPSHHSPAPYPPPPKDYDILHTHRPSWDYDHEDGRERSRGRGRGRPRGRGRGDYDRRRTADSGWGRRGGPHSPPRNSRYGS